MKNITLNELDEEIININAIENLADIEKFAEPLAKYYEFKSIKTMKEFHEKVTIEDIKELDIYFLALHANYENNNRDYGQDSLLRQFLNLKSMKIENLDNEEIFI